MTKDKFAVVERFRSARTDYSKTALLNATPQGDSPALLIKVWAVLTHQTEMGM